MPGQGRTFRRQIADFWQIWPMPPKIETSRDVVFVDGIYLAKKACILICYDGEHVLGCIYVGQNSLDYGKLLCSE